MSVTLEGDDSDETDSGRLRGGTGGGTVISQPRLKVTMEETEDDPVQTTDTQTDINVCTETEVTCRAE